VDEELAGLPCTSKSNELMISEFYGVYSLQQLSEQARQDYTCFTGGTWNKTNPPKPSAQDKNETKQTSHGPKKSNKKGVQTNKISLKMPHAIS
jgi:hypothetical protein